MVFCSVVDWALEVGDMKPEGGRILMDVTAAGMKCKQTDTWEIVPGGSCAYL